MVWKPLFRFCRFLYYPRPLYVYPLFIYLKCYKHIKRTKRKGVKIWEKVQGCSRRGKVYMNIKKIKFSSLQSITISA